MLDDRGSYLLACGPSCHRAWVVGQRPLGTLVGIPWLASRGPPKRAPRWCSAPGRECNWQEKCAWRPGESGRSSFRTGFAPVPFCVLHASREPRGGSFEVSWGSTADASGVVVEISWYASREPRGSSFDAFGGRFGASWDLSGPLGGVLGAAWNV